MLLLLINLRPHHPHSSGRGNVFGTGQEQEEAKEEVKEEEVEEEEEQSDGGGRKSCCQASVSAAFITWRLEDTLDVCFQRRVKSGLGPHHSEE